MTEKEKLGQEFKRIRENIPSKEYNGKPISQQELADSSTGVTKHFIGTIERGEANPTLEKIFYLAKSLNLKTVSILNVEINVEKFIKEIDK